MVNILNSGDVTNSLIAGIDLPSNKTNVKKLIPFKADDEDDEIIDQDDSNMNALDTVSGKALTKSNEPHTIKQNNQIEHSIFIR